VYAVGVLLTEMVSGQPPYQVSSPVALAEAQRTPPLAIEGAPPSLSAIVRPTLDPDPEGRPSSAGALAAELRSWLETDAAPGALDSAPDAPTLAAIPVPLLTPVPPVHPVSPVPPALTGAPPTPSERPRAQRLSPVPAAVIAAIVMLVALVLLLAAITEPREPVSSPSPTASASPSPSPSASPTPTPAPAPLTFSEAMEAFKDLVDRGEEEGLIEGEAAEDLGDLANEIEKAVEDGSQGDVNKAFRDLRRAIDEFGRDGSIGSDDVAASLQDAVDEIEAASGR
jgi:serine/threonine-protein kinase